VILAPGRKETTGSANGAPRGIYVSTGSPSISRLFQEFFIGPRLLKSSDKRVVVIDIGMNQKDLVFIKELIEAGKVLPVIDRRYPLSQVTEAFRYCAKGHARRKVVIIVKPNN
jgi:NADPH:quinone reductase-like Zn-dependent oxidoreductase